jgi:glycolate oxidase
MALEKVVYKAIEDIVGKDYVTEEPAILDGYSFVWGNELVYGDKFGPRHDAVVLPGSTEEVQAIVKLFNKHGIKYKAHASGFVASALGGKKGFVPLDMRRMNRILDIDEKNRYAIVEPCVSMGQLQIEAMKKGLRPWSSGAGSATSVIAMACCLAGTSVANISAGHGGRNPLAVEWVLPDGEILRLGTLGVMGEWFCGDGPGSSLRGLMRGYYGPQGGLGVITKAAVKLVPWYGPRKLKTTGSTPKYLIETPENFKICTITFPSIDKLYEAFRLFCEEEITFSCTRRGPFTLCAGASGSNKEVYEMWQRGYFQNKYAHVLSIVIDASSTSEMLYREKVLKRILEETNGELEPEDASAQTARFGHAVLGVGSVKGVFRATGGYVSAPSYNEALGQLKKCQEAGVKIKEKYEEKGVILGDEDSTSVITYASGLHGGHMETPIRYDPSIPDSVEGTRRLVQEANEELVKQKIGVNMMAITSGFGREFYGDGPLGMTRDWMKKIKQAFDPEDVSESSYYVSAKE